VSVAPAQPRLRYLKLPPYEECHHPFAPRATAAACARWKQIASSEMEVAARRRPLMLLPHEELSAYPGSKHSQQGGGECNIQDFRRKAVGA
jgi:hypothetical protein